jgi:hypothetical protein
MKKNYFSLFKGLYITPKWQVFFLICLSQNSSMNIRYDDDDDDEYISD